MPPVTEKPTNQQPQIEETKDAWQQFCALVATHEGNPLYQNLLIEAAVGGANYAAHALDKLSQYGAIQDSDIEIIRTLNPALTTDETQGGQQ